jgi:ABC-type Mn2+/Zn2+ transport system ATPase subunit
MGRFRRIGHVRRPGNRDREAVGRALSITGIGELGAVLFRELSGGQRQRALIARALSGDPDLLILDEPTSGLDLSGGAAIMDLIDHLNEERGLTTVMVSHQLNTVAKWVDHVGLLHRGHLDFGTREEIFTSETLSHVYGPGARVVTVGEDRLVLPPKGNS